MVNEGIEVTVQVTPENMDKYLAELAMCDYGGKVLFYALSQMQIKNPRRIFELTIKVKET